MNFVATGSFNYSNNADTRNEENLVFIHMWKLRVFLRKILILFGQNQIQISSEFNSVILVM